MSRLPPVHSPLSQLMRSASRRPPGVSASARTMLARRWSGSPVWALAGSGAVHKDPTGSWPVPQRMSSGAGSPGKAAAPERGALRQDSPARFWPSVPSLLPTAWLIPAIPAPLLPPVHAAVAAPRSSAIVRESGDLRITSAPRCPSQRTRCSPPAWCCCYWRARARAIHRACRRAARRNSPGRAAATATVAWY